MVLPAFFSSPVSPFTPSIPGKNHPRNYLESLFEAGSHGADPSQLQFPAGLGMNGMKGIRKMARRCFVWVAGGIGWPECQRRVEEPEAGVALLA